MSIESNLKTLAENSTRIADALETLVSKLGHIGAATASVETAAPAQPAAAPVAPQAPAAPTAPVAEQPAPTAPAAPQAPSAPVAPAAPAAPAQPAAAPAMTPEELNNALVVEFQRLGGREKIDAAIREFGAATITDLPAEQYQPLLAKVQAIPA